MRDICPEIRVLTPTQVAKVHGDALKVLWQTGIHVDDPDALKRFEKALGRSFEDGRVRIPGELVQWALDLAPSSVDIHDRLGRKGFTLKGGDSDSPVFGIGVTNLHYQDPFDGKIHPFERRHMSQAAGLGHVLEAYDFISTPGVIRNLPSPRADLTGLLEMMGATTKPLVMLISDWEGFVPALDLVSQVCPDSGDRPFVIPYVNPITPLVLNAETTRKMDAAIARGLPLIFSNYGMSGATCPITPAGTLAVGRARQENKQRKMKS